MLNFKWTLSCRFILLIILFLFFSSQANANVNVRLGFTAEGKVVQKRGRVQIYQAISNKWVYAKPGSLLHSGDTIRTGANGKASLLMSDETIMQVGRNSRLEINHVAKNAGWFERSVIAKSIKKASRSVFSLLKGKLWARNKNKKVNARFRMVTATIGIRGTELVIEVKENGSVESTILEGRVEATNEHGSIMGEPGNQISIQPGQAPKKSILLNPEDAVQWTFVIPPLINTDDFSSDSISADIIQLVQSEDYAAASSKVTKQLSNAPDNSSLKLLDATLDIFNGQPKQALVKLNKLSSNMSNNALLSRSLATASVMIGDKKTAKVAADNAVRLEPDVASNHIVLAYVQQSRFELDEAMRSVNSALRIDPENIQVSVMLSQLLFGSGYADQAMNTLLAAHKKAPSNAEINNLAGFILLSQRKLDDAKNAFETALKNDPGKAESYMGLSLIYMRQGDTDLALESITNAVVLDPQRSLLLSYWGKMLYQVKRYDKALDMFEHAALLDKSDPTPVFYKSIILRDLNRPGEAIEALNQAVALNDNRGVYRSRFLLDQDLAVRNVDLSRLYSQLGLIKSAERKAVAAIKSDYTNYSGHLFYAGALSAYDDRSYPAGSEVLLARMLQPANVNTFNIFNDYTSFFEQPDIGGQITLRGGNDGTKGGDVIVYGAEPDSNFAYNFGLFGDTTDGWRETSSKESKAVAFIGKWQPSEENGVLVSAWYSEHEVRDRNDERYEFDGYSSPWDELNYDLGAVEIGYNRKISPSSNFLLYAKYKDDAGDFISTTDSELVVMPDLYMDYTTTAEYERPYYQLQLQYMTKFDEHQIIAGLLGFSGNSKQENYIDGANAVVRGQTLPVILDPLTAFDAPYPSYDLDISFISVYLQDNWSISDNVIIEAAVYFDKMDNADPFSNTTWEVEEVGPRLGLIWDATANNTLRLSAFKYVLPFVATRLDPVDVAGVPIFRNTEEGSIVKEVDLVWEYETENGLVSFGMFSLDKENPSSTVSLEGEIDGVDLSFETLLTMTTGLAASYKFSTIEDQTVPSLNRHDSLFTIALRNQQPNGFSIGIKNSYRVIVFDNDRDDEHINILDIGIGYEIGDKDAIISLEVNNILNEEANWVVDPYVVTGRNPAREVLVTGTVNF